MTSAKDDDEDARADRAALAGTDLTGLFLADGARAAASLSAPDPLLRDRSLPDRLFVPGRAFARRPPSAISASAGSSLDSRRGPRRVARRGAVVGPLPIGAIIDKYRLEELIGIGGFAVVYRATHLLLRTSVAIKLLRPELVRKRPGLTDQLLDEARCAARIQHPNVVRILDVTHTRAISYIVMEYIDGESVASAIDRRGAMPWERAVRIGIDVVSGLRAGLAEGLVHRDIKPANLLLGRKDEVRIVDFGLACALEPVGLGPLASGTGVGTRGYIAPEVNHAHHADFRADIFALGVTLLECLHGYRSRGRLEPLRVAHLPEPVARLLASMVAVEPRARPASYDALLESLREASDATRLPRASPSRAGVR